MEVHKFEIQKNLKSYIYATDTILSERKDNSQYA